MQGAIIWALGVFVAASGAAALWEYGNHERAAAVPQMSCPLDTKRCPDGSYVGRVGASCDFASCIAGNIIKSGDTARLSLGQSATVGGLTVLPYKILEDSRCPPDTNCKLQGTVRIEAQIIQQTGSGDAQLILGQTFKTETGSIFFSGVEPGAQKVKIKDSDYIFSIEITTH